MSHVEDHAYFSRRIAEEIALGDLAVNASIAAVHYELAQRYAMLVARGNRGRPKLTLVQGGNDGLRKDVARSVEERPGSELRLQACP